MGLAEAPGQTRGENSMSMNVVLLKLHGSGGALGRVYGLRFRVQGFRDLGFRVWGLGLYYLNYKAAVEHWAARGEGRRTGSVHGHVRTVPGRVSAGYTTGKQTERWRRAAYMDTSVQCPVE
jgi:hypothetical protein